MPKYRVAGWERIDWSVDVAAANEDEAERLARQYNLVTIATDDAHEREVVSVEELE